MTIQSFKDKKLRKLDETGKAPKGFPGDLVQRAKDMIDLLDYASTLEDLRVPPSNRLEALKGDRKSQHSVRINDQYRICFVWTDQGPAELEFVDYHKG